MPFFCFQPNKNISLPLEEIPVTRVYFMFKDLERTFKVLKHTFEGLKCTFKGLEGKILNAGGNFPLRAGKKGSGSGRIFACGPRGRVGEPVAAFFARFASD